MTKYETNNFGMPDINRPKFREKLDVLYSCRVRLTDQQREKLQTAWRARRDALTPVAAAPIPGSTVRTQSSYNVGELNSLSALTVSEILSSRETIGLPTILSMAAELGVEIFDKEYLKLKFEEYLTYIFDTAQAYGSTK